jgi:hypothetical protein
MTLVGTSVADERALRCMTFIEHDLRTRLSTNLPLCMHMKLQEWFDLENFPYHTLTQVGVHRLRGVVVVKLGAYLLRRCMHVSSCR